MKQGRLTFLGTGGSVGVPMIGCSCQVCQSKDPLNQRLRPSALLQIGHQQFLIDAGPDFRTQALKFGITQLDGLLLTHAHHDHTAGIDDLRPIYYQRENPLPVLLSAETAEDLLVRYFYLFPSDPEKTSRLQFNILPAQEGSIVFENVPIHYVTYTQGGMSVNGYRVGNLAYLSDIRLFSPSIFEHLTGVKYLVISALRYTPSPLHFSVDEAIAFARQIRAEHVWLTHLSHELEYHQANAYLPAHVHLAYDGLEIQFD
jgi:phosphoribosyl 1,2-cyclic phosphate phosphodiesterase